MTCPRNWCLRLVGPAAAAFLRYFPPAQSWELKAITRAPIVRGRPPVWHKDGPEADKAGRDCNRMKRSNERILTTHTGSLPRTAKVVELLLAEQKNPGARKAELDAAVREAIAHVVQKQIECGIDIINDGEQGRTDYTVHVLDRLAGFDGESTPPLGTGDAEFPELAQLLTHFASPFQYRPSCTGEVSWKNWAAAQADIDLSKEVMKGANATELFMTSPSPGQIARYLKNRHYETEEAYVYALADVMKREYEAIVDAGFILQLDCPDLAMLRHTVYLDRSLPISARSLR